MSIANAVEEDIAQGGQAALSKIPYWRTLKAEGFLNDKYLGGLEGHKKRLKREGYKIIAQVKKCQVADYERYLLKVYEVDPMLCPKCGGSMKVVAFIPDLQAIDRIIDQWFRWGREVYRLSEGLSAVGNDDGAGGPVSRQFPCS